MTSLLLGCVVVDGHFKGQPDNEFRPAGPVKGTSEAVKGACGTGGGRNFFNRPMRLKTKEVENLYILLSCSDKARDGLYQNSP
jgi:hypothetical protein